MIAKTDGVTVGRTDIQCDSYKPHSNFVCGGINMYAFNFVLINYKLS